LASAFPVKAADGKQQQAPLFLLLLSLLFLLLLLLFLRCLFLSSY
jgi:hypothetical protein